MNNSSNSSKGVLGNTDTKTRIQQSGKLNYCFTLFDYNKDSIKGLEIVLQSICKKIHISRRNLSRIKKEHLQGSLWLLKKDRITALKKYDLLKTAHFSEMISEKGSLEYCQKLESRKPDSLIYKFGFPKN